MKKQIAVMFLIAIMIVAVGGIVSALDSMKSGKQGEIYNITQGCGDATYITIYVTFPNSSSALDPVNMTSVGSGKYFYEFDRTSTLGRYDVAGVSDGCTRTIATYFKITPSGQEGTENIIFFLVILVLLYSLTLIFFFKKDINLAPFVTLSGTALGVFGLYMIRNGIIIYRDWFSNYLAYLTMGVGFGLGLWALISWIEDTL